MDSIKFLVNDPKRKQEAYQAMSLMYKHCDSEEKKEEFYRHFKSINADSSSDASFSDALCNP